MTTPPDPKGQPHPVQQPAPYGTGYGGARYPHPGGDQPPYGQQPAYGQPVYGQPAHGQQPYGQQPPGEYPYSPYGTGPAGLGGPDGAPARRPAIMVLALVLKILAMLPFLAAGVLFLLLPLDAATLPPGLVDNAQLAEAGITTETLVSFVRIIGGVFLALALLYVLFAALAFTGRNWARILVTVMTVGFVAFLLLGLTGGVNAADPATLAFLLGLIILPVAGVVILFLPPSNRYFSSLRR